MFKKMFTNLTDFIFVGGQYLPTNMINTRYFIGVVSTIIASLILAKYSEYASVMTGIIGVIYCWVVH